MRHDAEAEPDHLADSFFGMNQMLNVALKHENEEKKETRSMVLVMS